GAGGVVQVDRDDLARSRDRRHVVRLPASCAHRAEPVVRCIRNRISSSHARQASSAVDSDVTSKERHMSEQPQGGLTPTGTIASSADRRRVVVATVVGTTVEWYDFFIYAFAAATVFAALFFEPMGKEFSQIVSFFTVGVSFLFRPLGAFLAGHYGDRIGRRPMLVITLLLM